MCGRRKIWIAASKFDEFANGNSIDEGYYFCFIFHFSVELDGYHHSRFLRDFLQGLEAFKQSYEVRPKKSPRHFLSCFFQFNLCYKTTNCMFTNMFYFFIHKLAIGILGLCMAFLIPHLDKVLLSPVKKFFSLTF